LGIAAVRRFDPIGVQTVIEMTAARRRTAAITGLLTIG